LSGRDYAVNDPIGSQMANFAYAIGDRETGEALLVDPAYDVAGLLDALAEDDMTLTGVLGTHYHADHVGGSMMGHDIIGVAELLQHTDVPVHLQGPEVEYVVKTTGLAPTQLVGHASGDIVTVGSIEVELIHTPGHTPGSQCFLVSDRLLSGDTLFLDGCGRTDLPGGDAEALYHSLTGTLANVPDSATLFPGHQYSAEPSLSMAQTRARNVVFRPDSVEQWLAMFGR
jgi:glyoxylase-like metal-dependent hydrolase (beta-lactamase superfamily II)